MNVEMQWLKQNPSNF